MSELKETKNTPDWNYDKPYERGLETLTGIFFVKNKIFSLGRKFIYWGSVTVDIGCHIRTNVPKKTHLQLHFCAIDLFKNSFLT